MHPIPSPRMYTPLEIVFGQSILDWIEDNPRPSNRKLPDESELNDEIQKGMTVGGLRNYLNVKCFRLFDSNRFHLIIEGGRTQLSRTLEGNLWRVRAAAKIWECHRLRIDLLPREQYYVLRFVHGNYVHAPPNGEPATVAGLKEIVCRLLNSLLEVKHPSPLPIFHPGQVSILDRKEFTPVVPFGRKVPVRLLNREA